VPANENKNGIDLIKEIEMKILVLAFALVLNSTSLTFADDVVGRAELTTWSDFGGPSIAADIWEQNGQITGNGSSVGGRNGTISLARTADGVKGFSLNRFFDITCGADSCNGQSSTQVDLALERTATGFNLDGTINFISVHVAVSATDISVDADSSFQLTAGSDGVFSGQGASSFNVTNSYTAQLTSSGTLSVAKDPAVFIATFLNAAVR
jgi:hypothetical protein